MTILVDTSALLALLLGNDRNHSRAQRVFDDPVLARSFVTHNYVISESIALMQRRFGTSIVRDLVERVLPMTEVIWVLKPAHDAALSALLASSRRRVSFVDQISFEVMRRNEIDTAFAFDKDFRQQGFRTIP